MKYPKLLDKWVEEAGTPKRKGLSLDHPDLTTDPLGILRPASFVTSYLWLVLILSLQEWWE